MQRKLRHIGGTWCITVPHPTFLGGRVPPVPAGFTPLNITCLSFFPRGWQSRSYIVFMKANYFSVRRSCVTYSRCLFSLTQHRNDVWSCVGFQARMDRLAVWRELFRVRVVDHVTWHFSHKSCEAQARCVCKRARARVCGRRRITEMSVCICCQQFYHGRLRLRDPALPISLHITPASNPAPFPPPSLTVHTSLFYFVV